MYAISLTSIPPRFARLAPVLQSLLTQEPAPARVFLCLPAQFARFPGASPAPALPDGVEWLPAPQDDGPATKALTAARYLAGKTDRLIYCDDDWIMPPGWAAALLDAQRSGEAVTGAGFGIHRLGRQTSHPPDRGLTDIAQGFSGVLIHPSWLSAPECAPPDEARAVDDIWLSGQLARQGIVIREAKTARQGMKPAYQDEHALQDSQLNGLSRDAANRACAAELHRRYGIWPALPARGGGPAGAGRPIVTTPA